MGQNALQTPHSPRRSAFPSTQKAKGPGKSSYAFSFLQLSALSFVRLFLRIVAIFKN